jgi:hypothetical protein
MSLVLRPFFCIGVANSASRLVSAATMKATPKLGVFSQEAANFVEQMRRSASQFVHPASANVASVSAPARDLLDTIDSVLNNPKGFNRKRNEKERGGERERLY